MRISDWSSDVCSSDLAVSNPTSHGTGGRSSATGACEHWSTARAVPSSIYACHAVGALKSRLNVWGRVIRLWRNCGGAPPDASRSEEHTSELQSLMRISYAVFCLKKKKKHRRYRMYALSH